MPTPNAQNSLGRSSTLDSLLGASEVILTLVKDVSSVATVPFMRDAAELSLGFLNTVQVSYSQSGTRRQTSVMLGSQGKQRGMATLG